MLLETVNLTKIYKNKKHYIKALNNFTYTFKSGHIYGIVGLNGAGKTTLIKIICGLLIPDDGNVYFDGCPLYPRGQKNLRQIGAILEGSRNIFWNFTPMQNVKYFSLLRGLDLKKTMTKASVIFKEFDLNEKINTPVRNLSQGMKQKIAIAISLLHDPMILLFDEPTLGLDPLAGNKMQDYILKFAKENKKIIIITSHQLSILENICDEIIFLKKGSIISSQRVAESKVSSKQTIYRIKVTKNDDFKIKESINHPFMNIEIKEDWIELTFNSQDTTLEEILNLLKSFNISIIDIEKQKLSLEEVFLKEMGT